MELVYFGAGFTLSFHCAAGWACGGLTLRQGGHSPRCGVCRLVRPVCFCPTWSLRLVSLRPAAPLFCGLPAGEDDDLPDLSTCGPVREDGPRSPVEVFILLSLGSTPSDLKDAGTQQLIRVRLVLQTTSQAPNRTISWCPGRCFHALSSLHLLRDETRETDGDAQSITSFGSRHGDLRHMIAAATSRCTSSFFS